MGHIEYAIWLIVIYIGVVLNSIGQGLTEAYTWNGHKGRLVKDSLDYHKYRTCYEQFGLVLMLVSAFNLKERLMLSPIWYLLLLVFASSLLGIWYWCYRKAYKYEYPDTLGFDIYEIRIFGEDSYIVYPNQKYYNAWFIVSLITIPILLTL